MLIKKRELSKKIYICEKCDYECFYKSDYNRHKMTAKHKRLINANISDEKNDTALSCLCGKIYKQAPSLSRHKKVCKFINNQMFDQDVENKHETLNNNEEHLNKIIEHQSQQTQELREIILKQNEIHQQQMKDQQEQHHKQIQELIPQLNQITNINNNQNNCNNKFNLNFFLNEQCKDAMSIQNFIQSLDIGIKELEHMGDVGYVNGMMNIFSNTLGAMDIYKRPLHCTDLKRETLYIKQGDTWEKDTDDKSSLKKLIKSVERKNYGTLRQWEKQHPDAFECDTPDNIEYMKISTESLGGEQSTDALKLNKIMKHVIKEVYVK